MPKTYKPRLAYVLGALAFLTPGAVFFLGLGVVSLAKRNYAPAAILIPCGVLIVAFMLYSLSSRTTVDDTGIKRRTLFGEVSIQMGAIHKLSLKMLYSGDLSLSIFYAPGRKHLMLWGAIYSNAAVTEIRDHILAVQDLPGTPP